MIMPEPTMRTREPGSLSLPVLEMKNRVLSDDYTGTADEVDF
jgi:hypothetical protein